MLQIDARNLVVVKVTGKYVKFRTKGVDSKLFLATHRVANDIFTIQFNGEEVNYVFYCHKQNPLFGKCPLEQKETLWLMTPSIR